MKKFPNQAGDHAETDGVLRAELKAAGIPTLQEHEGKPPEYLAEMLRRSSGEVKTSVIGILHGWEFKRAWYYWMAKGPGIPYDVAMQLHETHGKQVRVDGDCTCPSPNRRYKGLAVGRYHVDTPEGLKALADTIKTLVASVPGEGEDAPQPLLNPRGHKVEGLPFGIIDPDYAMAFTKFRITAWQFGYAITMQGSFTRDLDLVAIPWTEHASDIPTLIRALEYRTGLKVSGGAGIKPHGREAWTFLFPGFEDPRWVDLSIMPLKRAEPQSPEPVAHIPV